MLGSPSDPGAILDTPGGKTAGGFLMSFAADKVDQGRHPGMPGAFVDHAVMLADLDGGEITEGRFEQASRIEILDLRWSTRPVAELFGPVALHQQQPARLQRTLYSRENFVSKRRIGELDEDRRDQVECGNRPPPLREVRQLDPQLDAARRGQRACFLQ